MSRPAVHVFGMRCLTGVAAAGDDAEAAAEAEKCVARLKSQPVAVVAVGIAKQDQ